LVRAEGRTHVTRIHTVVIGGGQAGLAMSRCLLDRRIEHVVLERGNVAERWRSERWDSLRLLTPNWQTRLPGFRYDGPHPDGYMGMAELVAFFERYAASFDAPVQTGTTVLAVEQVDAGFRVATDRGDWIARHVVIATGYSDVPCVPPAAASLSPRIRQVVPTAYRRPDALAEGGVLVVGASATGVQLADEIHASGRPVTLAVGRHLRLPRTYRGRDILWWLDAMGVFAESAGSVADLRASRGQPSLQLVGRAGCRAIDIAALRRRGVRILGRLVAADGQRAWFDDDVIASAAASDLKLAQVRQRIDRYIAASGLDGIAGEPGPFEPTWPAVFDTVPTALDLEASGIRTVVWATGFRRSYPWLRVPALGRDGEIRHRGGVTGVPGLFVLGMHFQRRRNSAFIDGVGADAEWLADRIAGSDRGQTRLGAPRYGGQAGVRPAFALRATAGKPGSDWGLTLARYDVVVVGGRVAGAATAMLLARAGLDVLVVEQGARGADTLSTLAIMRGGVMQLARWGLLESVRAAGAPPIRTTTFHYGEDSLEVPIAPRDGVDALYAPRRTVLDTLLADAAAAAGADVRYRTRLVHVHRDDGGRVRGVTIGTRDGDVRIDTPLVIGADGVHSTVARQVGADAYLTGAHASAVIYGFARGLDVEGYHWHYAPGASAGVIPTNDGETLVFASMPRDRFMRELRADLASGFHTVLAEAAPALAAALRVTPPAAFRGFAGIRGYFRTAAGPGWALAGDAGYFKDPLTAHGITDALRDAELLARAVLAGTDQALATYQTTRDELSLPLFRVTDRIASFQWDLAEARALHKALSKAMAREVQHLGALHRAPRTPHLKTA
jgi:putative flavoprotein involved in K+ transport